MLVWQGQVAHLNSKHFLPGRGWCFLSQRGNSYICSILAAAGALERCEVFQERCMLIERLHVPFLVQAVLPNLALAWVLQPC